MYRLLFFFVTIVASMSSLSWGGEATSTHLPIGFAFASGEFLADGYQIRSNISLFDGTLLATDASPLHLILNSGTRMDLARESRALIHKNQLTLEKGSLQCRGSCSAIVNDLRIGSTTPYGCIRASLLDDHLQVSVVAGNGTVSDARGNLLGSISAGHALQFSLAGTEVSVLHGTITDRAFLGGTPSVMGRIKL